MVCYTCGGETVVKNSRHQKRSNSVWRRRQCIMCDTVFTTNEGIDFTKSIVVRPRLDGTLEPFSRDRLMLSLYKSLGHRSNALRDASDLCATIITKATRTAQNSTLDAQTVAEITLVALNRFDTLAARHYQAMHKL